MAFTDFKSLAQVQQEYNIKYVEESFISYINLRPSDQFCQEFEFNLGRLILDSFTKEKTRIAITDLDKLFGAIAFLLTALKP